MSNSSSVRQLNYPLGQKVNARNPIYRSTVNIGEGSSTNKPFTRKPINQIDQPSLQNIKHNDKQLDMSLLQKSGLDNQSVVSGDCSVRQGKFVRTSKMGFLSPKSKIKERDESFSPRHGFGTKSVIIRAQMSRSKKELNQSILQKQQAISQSSVQQNQIYLHKSISSNNLFKRNNKTRNMILSKFNQLAKNSGSKENKNKLETSLYTSCIQNQKEEKKKIERMNVEFRQKNVEIQKQCDELWNQNGCLKQENSDLKEEVTQLTRRLNEIQSSRSNLVLEQKTFARTNQSLYNSASTSSLVARQKPAINVNSQGGMCVKCDQKQKSNQKQVTYYQNIIKKKEGQISALKLNEFQLNLDNQQLNLEIQQIKVKLSQLMEHQKNSFSTEQKLEEYVGELKESVSRLKDELRYLKIENSVLLKIKNENLKLKIDITKIQDERDYFKMKVIEIHKKHSDKNTTRGGSEKYIRDKLQCTPKLVNSQKLKKVYLDSTETDQMDMCDFEVQRIKTKSKTLPGFQKHTDIKQTNTKSKHQQTDFTSAYSDTLFDLTSEESQNSY